MFLLLKRLWGHIGFVRRVQLGLLLGIMLLASFVEMFSIGMVIPFLGVLTDPERIYHHHFIAPLAGMLGISTPEGLLLPVTLIFLTGVILSAVIRFAMIWMQTQISLVIVSEMAVKAYWRTLHQPYAVHIARNSSEIISGILNKISGGIGSTIAPILLVISSTLITLGVLVALIAFNPLIALSTFIGFGIIYSVILFLTKKRLAHDSLRISQAANDIVKTLQEGLGGIRDIILDGTQETYSTAYRRADVKLRQAQGSIQTISAAPKFAIEAIGIVFIAGLAYWYSTQPGGVITVIPILGALAIGAQRLLPVLQQGYSSWALVQGAQSSLRDVLDLLDHPVADISPLSAQTAISFTKEIRLEHVAFQYAEQAPHVLRDVSVSLPKGGRIGFIGITGSGKSTLMDILMGLLRPTEGTLLIDGCAVMPANQRAWQAHIAHVPQAIFLSDASIAENIAFGLPRSEIDFDRVKVAARQAQIADDIESWQGGYETRVGERGIMLSGGQRQRIGIARALYKRADVIIFDEATSALDGETELAVMQAIDQLGGDLTILIIAHRLTTLEHCTQIVELESGCIKRVGSYADIIERSGRLQGALEQRSAEQRSNAGAG
jgi:ATP-binding cassette subfamily B protein